MSGAVRLKRRLALAVAAVFLLAAACGGDGASDADGSDPSTSEGFASVEEGVGRIDSGRIELALRAVNPDDPPRGFEMSGIFASAASPEELPVAELTYRQLLPTATKQSQFVSDGSRAWVITDRGVTELMDDKLEPLRGGEDPAGIRELGLGEWFADEPAQRPGEALDGTPTVVYGGEVDAPAVLNDLLGMTASLGANVPAPLNAEGLELVREAVQSAEAAVVAGEEDNLVRKITFSMQLPPDRNDLLDALGRLYAERLEFELTLTDVNKPVAPPAEPQGPAAPTTTTQPPPDFPEPPTIPS